jgi:hypothetical protein
MATAPSAISLPDKASVRASWAFSAALDTASVLPPNSDTAAVAAAKELVTALPILARLPILFIASSFPFLFLKVSNDCCASFICLLNDFNSSCSPEKLPSASLASFIAFSNS